MCAWEYLNTKPNGAQEKEKCVYFAGENEDEEKRRSELRVREHDDVHQIGIGWRLEEQPAICDFIF